MLHKASINVKGAIYPKMYACQAPNWTQADAYATARLCTLQDVNCVARSVGLCSAEVVPEKTSQPWCERDDASGFGDYGGCLSPEGEPFYEVITPFLHRPCDVVDDPDVCNAASYNDYNK